MWQAFAASAVQGLASGKGGGASAPPATATGGRSDSGTGDFNVTFGSQGGGINTPFLNASSETVQLVALGVAAALVLALLVKWSGKR